MTGDDRNLLRRAHICQTFPGYKLEDIENLAARPLLRALRLLAVEQIASRL